ncbi:MAG: hypothetical protein ACRDRJ_19670 [Streptosporangiaceae bacterium]
MRRDVIYAGYKDLVEEFQTRVKAQDSTPQTMRDLAGRNAELAGKLTEARAELAAERAAGAALRLLNVEPGAGHFLGARLGIFWVSLVYWRHGFCRGSA